MLPKILIISDVPNWAIARNVDAIASRLSHKYDIVKGALEGPFSGMDYVDANKENYADYDLVIFRTVLHLPGRVLGRLEACDPGRIVATVASERTFDVQKLAYIFKNRMFFFKNIFCVSDGVYEKTRAFIGEDENVTAHFTPQGVEPEAFYNTRVDRERGRKTRIGWAGNVMHGYPEDHKRFFEILLPLIDKTHDKYEYHIAARGLENKDKEWLLEKGAVIGEVGFGDMRDWYNGIDIMLNASRSEAVANTTCEAMACGTPVVTTDVGHARNIIYPWSNGAIIEMPTVKNFISAIGKIDTFDFRKVYRINQFVLDNILSWDILISYTDIAIERVLNDAA